ncbi:MAG: PilZ domain-containing protein [Deltaproteobacteria bacterium]|nr:PilZ domain-containing protein [Deltaproteobacteria bacterium]
MTQEEKRENVRAALRCRVHFSVMEASDYEALKNQPDFVGRCSCVPTGFSLEFAVPETEEGERHGAGPDPNLIDFLIHIEDKLDRILALLTKYNQTDRPQIYEAKALDISGCGMRIVSEAQVAPGQILDMEFRMFRYPVVLLQTFGRVVRVIPGEGPCGGQHEIALEFLDLDEAYREWIISYVFQAQRKLIRRERQAGRG